MVFEKKVPQNFTPINNEIVITTNENTRRIRILEQTLDSIRNRLSSIEERLIDEMGDTKKWMDQVSLDMKEISNDLKEIRTEILRINKDLDKAARKTEVKELENLLDIYNPIKSHFVTKDEVIRLLGKKM
jgi:hypothetical protein